MSRYLLRQLSLLLVTLWLLTLLAFGLGHWFSGDFITNTSGIFPEDIRFADVAEARAAGADVFSQYSAYLSHLFRGDWGVSLLDGEPVFEQIALRFGATLEIALLAFILALLPGVPLGVIAALYFRKTIDHTILTLSLSGYSIPVFWFAQIAILVIAIHWGLVPISGQINPLYEITPRSGSIILDIFLEQPEHMGAALHSAFAHMVLPICILAIMPMMLIIRLMRNSMLDVLGQNFITSGYAKGLSTARVLWNHALPNAMQQVMRQLGTLISLLITNTMIIEVIFSWPGLGSWLVRSIYERDYPVIQGGLLVISALILLITIALNIFHAWRYPQVRKDLYAAS
ncbi:ABC transporter permease [Aliidiomarina halalkaliphila]|uniref:ABC transporter permease n=1 Tax=Aliidiomarina halalkaliphila TaxID=2593535 RepID=A0A552X3X0_9GAMM|nr:ABC transporter permease [Aliidiomarina halalkaliphila]TRW49656.1 ABC transporter permease [Aliidiomarina halalkaliphila]